MSLEKFNFNGNDVRVVIGEDGEPRWVASDVAKVLGFSEASAMTRHLDEDEKGLSTWQTPGGAQKMLTINESGLYSAILRSRKPEAMDLELFRIKETAISHSDGHVSVSKTSKVTGKGQQYFISRFLEGKFNV